MDQIWSMMSSRGRFLIWTRLFLSKKHTSRIWARNNVVRLWAVRNLVFLLQLSLNTLHLPPQSTSLDLGVASGGVKKCEQFARTNHGNDFCWEKFPDKKPYKFRNKKDKQAKGNVAVTPPPLLQEGGSSTPNAPGSTALSFFDIATFQRILSQLQTSTPSSSCIHGATLVPLPCSLIMPGLLIGCNVSYD